VEYQEMIFAEIQDAFPTIQEADKNYLCMYLDKLKAQSKNSFTCTKGTLKQFYECVKVSICDLTYSDVNAYINYLATYFSNNATKRGHLVRVKAYYHFVLKYLGAQGIYKHDFFKIVNIPFLHLQKEKRVDGYKVDAEEIEGKIKFMSIELIDKILAAASFRSQMVYVLLLILKYCGMRLSEAITIRIDNIDLDRRVIFSGTVLNYAKEGRVIHPFPIHVGTEIRKLLATYAQDAVWLFPGRDTHIKTPQTTIKNFQKRSGITGWASHQFRHSLIKRRTMKGCPREIKDLRFRTS